ncbi:LANO_0F08438g1_1 [Lachancea nothofagi CBS 11611]|uniref:Meiotic nuclear division protein 1 n=1 Tax=Lachancea nothofagi CBS 11611 TaxID=1266666 RepID=A0A1G4K9H4_9SACH|nr:LANO_0F08438g1_1 [Lachancea nothofagi CBS 11611]
MPPKGRATVSLAQKKASILQFFQDDHSVYNIKELEKLIPKKCSGVSSMLVKGLIQEMIDEDGIISVEKCGSTNVYWCFRNQIIMKTHQEMDTLHTRIESAKQETIQAKNIFEENVNFLRKDRFDVGGHLVSRAEQLGLLESLEVQLRTLRASRDQKAENRWDQSKIEARIKALSVQIGKLEAVTDNIELITGFVCRRFMVDPKSLRTELGIPEEFMEFTNLPRCS